MSEITPAITSGEEETMIEPNEAAEPSGASRGSANTRADGVRVAHPLFQAGGDGSMPISALCLTVERIPMDMACDLNRRWHSRLPKIEKSNVLRNADYVCYGAMCGGIAYAAAIWSSPVARLLNDGRTLELRRLAIAPDAPRNTASRMLAVMRRLVVREKPHIERLVSYQDTEVHTGGIYRASGWTAAHLAKGREWTCPSRHRGGVQSAADKVRWETQAKRN